jgi:hypothetical protein
MLVRLFLRFKVGAFGNIYARPFLQTYPNLPTGSSVLDFCFIEAGFTLLTA